MQAVVNRSNSRNCGATEALVVTKQSGSCSRRISAARSSWAGFRYENRKHTATDSTPHSASSRATARTASSSSGTTRLAVRRRDPLGHGQAVAAAHERRRLPGDVLHHRVRLRPLMASDVDDVAHALGGDHSGQRAAVLEHRVGGHGGAVEQTVELARGHAGAVAQLDDSRRPSPRRDPVASSAPCGSPAGRYSESNSARSVNVPPMSTPTNFIATPPVSRRAAARVDWRRDLDPVERSSPAIGQRARPGADGPSDRPHAERGRVPVSAAGTARARRPTRSRASSSPRTWRPQLTPTWW